MADKPAARDAAAGQKLAMVSCGLYRSLDHRVGMRSGMGDAAALCDAIATDIEQGMRPSRRRSDLLAVALRCSAAIDQMRSLVRVPDADPGLAARLAAHGAGLSANALHFPESSPLRARMAQQGADLLEAARLLGHAPAPPQAQPAGQEPGDELAPADGAASRAAGGP